MPPCVARLVEARNAVRKHYAEVLGTSHAEGRLAFTFDGNLVGDLGEAIAAERFGIRLVNDSGHAGIDGHTRDGRSVQIKATTTRRGPAFRQVLDAEADHLLFFELDLEQATATVVFNGPLRQALAKLPATFAGQRSLTAGQIRSADATVPDDERLPLVAIEP